MSEQDLARWHTSNTIKEKIVKLKLRMFDWPRKSPDLNPVEILKSILNKNFSTKAALIDRLEEE